MTIRTKAVGLGVVVFAMGSGLGGCGPNDRNAPEATGATKQADMQSFLTGITTYRATSEVVELPFVQDELCVLTRIDTELSVEAEGVELGVDESTHRWQLKAWGESTATASCIHWNAFTIWGGGSVSPSVSRPNGFEIHHDDAPPVRTFQATLWDANSFCALSGVGGSWEGRGNAGWVEHESTSIDAGWLLNFTAASERFSSVNAMCASFELGRPPLWAGGDYARFNTTPTDVKLTDPGEPAFCFLTGVGEASDGRILAYIDRAPDGRQYLGGNNTSFESARCLYWIQ